MWFLYPNTRGDLTLRLARGTTGEKLDVETEKCNILVNRLVRYSQHLYEALEALKQKTLTEEEKSIYTQVAMRAPWALVYRPGDVIVMDSGHIPRIPK